jgi:hypothetical protein
MRNGRAMALFCCREMSAAFEPRGNDRDECERCLRGAFWAVVQLRQCLVDDPSDGEVEMMLGALERFLISRYGVTAVPADRVARAQLAAVRALAWSKRQNHERTTSP